MEVNKVRRRALGLLTACFIVLVLGYFEAAWIDYYFNPRLIPTMGKVYLVYRRNPALRSTAASYIHESPDGMNWSEARDLSPDPGAVQIMGDKLLLVRGRHFSTYDFSSGAGAGDPEWLRSGTFKLDWSAAIVLAEGESLRLLGLEEAKQDKIRIREALLLTSESVRELPFSLEIEQPEQLAACMLAGDLYIMYRKRNGRKVNLFRRKAQQEWEPLGEIPGNLVKFDCAGAAGELHVVGTPVRRGADDDWRLVHCRLDPGGSLLSQKELLHSLKTFYGTPRAVSEVSLAGTRDALYLAVRCGSVVATTVWREGAWSGFVTVNKMPMVTRVVMSGWMASVLALCIALMVTAFQLYRAKRRKPAAAPPVHKPVVPAAIGRRLIAFVIDLLIIGTITLVVAQPARGIAANRSVLDLVSLQHPLILKVIFLAYFALPEALFGRTIGKYMLGIVVRSVDGKRAGIWAAVLRNLFKLMEILLMIELFVLLHTVMYTGKSQRFGDIVAGTVVVKKK